MFGSALGRLVNRAEQVWCRHDYVPAFEKNRSFLRCAKCQRETPGWTLDEFVRPISKYPGDPNRFAGR